MRSRATGIIGVRPRARRWEAASSALGALAVRVRRWAAVSGAAARAVSAAAVPVALAAVAVVSAEAALAVVLPAAEAAEEAFNASRQGGAEPRPYGRNQETTEYPTTPFAKAGGVFCAMRLQVGVRRSRAKELYPLQGFGDSDPDHTLPVLSAPCV